MAQEQKESIDSVHEQLKKLGFCFRTGVESKESLFKKKFVSQEDWDSFVDESSETLLSET